MNESLIAVRDAVDRMDDDNIQDLVKDCLSRGIKPMEIIEEGISKGLDIVGEKFEEGEYFLADLIMAGEAVDVAMEVVRGEMDPDDLGKKGKGHSRP